MAGPRLSPGPCAGEACTLPAEPAPHPPPTPHAGRRLFRKLWTRSGVHRGSCVQPALAGGPLLTHELTFASGQGTWSRVAQHPWPPGRSRVQTRQLRRCFRESLGAAAQFRLKIVFLRKIVSQLAGSEQQGQDRAAGRGASFAATSFPGYSWRFPGTLGPSPHSSDRDTRECQVGSEAICCTCACVPRREFTHGAGAEGSHEFLCQNRNWNSWGQILTALRF